MATDLYKAESSSGPYQLLACLGGDRTSYTDDTLAMEKTYYYKVIAYRLLGSMRFDSLCSDAMVVSTPPVYHLLSGRFTMGIFPVL